eukprot:6570116-Prorocentrum_lima.AAC.1
MVQSDRDQDCLVGTAGGGGGQPRAWLPLVVGRVAGVEQPKAWLPLVVVEGRVMEEGIVCIRPVSSLRRFEPSTAIVARSQGSS